MAFTPFFQGTDATNLIQGYLNKNITADTPFEPADMNANNVFRNPYSPEGFYANDTDMYPVDTYKPPVNDSEGIPNCEEGYVYDEVLKSCRFVGYSKPAQEQNRDREDIEERPYFSIEEMKKLGDAELLDYLNDGWLKGKPYDTSVGGQFGMPPAFQFMFGGQNKMRRDFIISELAKRGYNIDTDKGQLGLGQSLSILNNANLANKYVNEDPRSTAFFTPEEINYQIQAKQNAQNIVDQYNQGIAGANPYGQSYTGSPKDIHDQVKADAIASGGTYNPFEGQNINAGGNNNSTVSSPPTNVGNPFGYNNTPSKPPFLS